MLRGVHKAYRAFAYNYTNVLPYTCRNYVYTQYIYIHARAHIRAYIDLLH